MNRVDYNELEFCSALSPNIMRNTNGREHILNSEKTVPRESEADPSGVNAPTWPRLSPYGYIRLKTIHLFTFPLA